MITSANCIAKYNLFIKYSLASRASNRNNVRCLFMTQLIRLIYSKINKYRKLLAAFDQAIRKVSI